MKKWIPFNYIILIVFGIVYLSSVGYSQQPKLDNEGKKAASSVNVAVLSKLNEQSGQEIFVPRITGDWVHVYKPESDVFPGPDSKRFKTGVKYDDWQVNDHATIKGADDCWHAIGITHPAVAAGPGEFNPHEAEWLSFHAVSSKGTFKQNLVEHSWKDRPKILPPGERPGEIRENHAPHIIPYRREYLMIYGPSPIRYATSNDLYTWKPRGELFSQTGGARDPSVMQYNGLYYMAYCSNQSVMARVSADLLKWSEPITIFELPEGETGGPESPTIHYYKGSFYLLFCRWDAKQTTFTYQDKSFIYHSDNPLDFRNRQPVAEIQGHAPELFQDEDGDWWISSAERPFRGVSIAPVKWVQLKTEE
ncbi:MAG: family 43 glycosylhydrolase [Prolixibacteraceae bacterium]|nr:family 43 glycosylhydrolase [Prolixibacteraceae bacterium]